MARRSQLILNLVPDTGFAFSLPRPCTGGMETIKTTETKETMETIETAAAKETIETTKNPETMETTIETMETMKTMETTKTETMKVMETMETMETVESSETKEAGNRRNHTPFCFRVEIPQFALSSFLIALSRAVRLGRKEHACLGASILRERASSIGSSTEVPSLLLTIPCFPEDWPNTGRALWVGWAFLGAFLPFSPYGQRKWILVFPKALRPFPGLLERSPVSQKTPFVSPRNVQ